MKKQTMFIRMVTASVLRRRSRMAVALLAIAIGAAILSGLVTIYYDVPRQLGAQFRSYGANMIIVPDSGSHSGAFGLDEVQRSISPIPADKIVGVAPYEYETVLINNFPVIAAGTDIAGAKAASPYWIVNGEWCSQSGQIIVGEDCAESFALRIGDTLTLTYQSESDAQTNIITSDREMTVTVTGILDTGGSEEEYIFMSLSDLEELTGLPTDIDVAELSVSATQDELQGYADAIKAAYPGVTPRLVKRVTQSETTVLTKLQALVFLVTLVVLMLTMICVSTTMAASAAERRKEIGLRKALGASNGSIIGEFMGEGLLLGCVGGIIGSILGFGFAQIVSMNVFNSSITFRFLLLPITVIVSVLVTGLSCLMPVRSAADVDPALVLKGE